LCRPFTSCPSLHSNDDTLVSVSLPRTSRTNSHSSCTTPASSASCKYLTSPEFLPEEWNEHDGPRDPLRALRGQCFIFGALYPSEPGLVHKHIVKRETYRVHCTRASADLIHKHVVKQWRLCNAACWSNDDDAPHLGLASTLEICSP
jgi:hypothetical protein